MTRVTGQVHSARARAHAFVRACARAWRGARKEPRLPLCPTGFQIRTHTHTHTQCSRGGRGLEVGLPRLTPRPPTARPCCAVAAVEEHEAEVEGPQAASWRLAATGRFVPSASGTRTTTSSSSAGWGRNPKSTIQDRELRGEIAARGAGRAAWSGARLPASTSKGRCVCRAGAAASRPCRSRCRLIQSASALKPRREPAEDTAGSPLHYRLRKRSRNEVIAVFLWRNDGSMPEFVWKKRHLVQGSDLSES
jgi:hypothetical protein